MEQNKINTKCMYNKYLIIISVAILFISFLSSCKKKELQPIHIVTMNQTRPIDELKELVLQKGDTSAYFELRVAFMSQKHEEEYLIYSLLMANKYNVPIANFDAYDCIVSIFEKNKMPIDDRSKELALSYLKKGVELKEKNALSQYGQLLMLGKYITKDSLLGKRLYDEAWK